MAEKPKVELIRVATEPSPFTQLLDVPQRSGMHYLAALAADGTVWYSLGPVGGWYRANMKRHAEGVLPEEMLHG